MRRELEAMLAADARTGAAFDLPTYQVRNDAASRILFTVLGTGKRGSYILFLGTSQADFAANNALYQQWYRSLTLY
jgi:hypothetical protein